MSAQPPPPSARPRRPRGPIATGVRIAWWVFAVALVGPILIGVIRGSF